MVVTTGDDRDPIEMNTLEGSLVFPDLTSTEYNVTGLTEGGTYRFLVVTHFADGTTAKSNSQVVTLTDQPEPIHQPGDVNHDGNVSIEDVTDLIDYLLGGNDGVCLICADVNGDQGDSIGDVTALIDRLLGGN